MSHHDTEGRTMRTRRVSQALALLLAPWAFVLANAGDVLTSVPGEDDTTPRGALLIAAAHPTAEKWFTFAAMVGCVLGLAALFLIPPRVLEGQCVDHSKDPAGCQPSTFDTPIGQMPSVRVNRQGEVDPKSSDTRNSGLPAGGVDPSTLAGRTEYGSLPFATNETTERSGAPEMRSSRLNAQYPTPMKGGLNEGSWNSFV